jgi:O-antigen/teichoic acid export membrane protein
VISFSGAFLRIQILLANREERFKDVVHSRILSTLVTALSSIVCGLLLFKSNGLILSLILGNLSGAFFLRFYKTTTSYYNKKEFLKIFKRYKNFFYYSLPSDLMNIGTSRYPLLAFPLMMESEIIGYLALAYRVVCLPSRFVSNAVAEIFFQHARKEMETNKECRNLFLLTTGMLIVVGLVGFGSLFLLSDFLFELFFGPTWKLAGTYVKILIPLFLIIFIVSTLNSMIYVAEKQNLNLIWQTIYLAAILGSTVGSWFFYGGAETILLSFVIAASMAYGIYFWMLYGLARGKKDKLP